MTFVRYESLEPSPSGRRPGVFALVNGLAHDGRLTPEERLWWRENNDWFNAVLTDPAVTDTTIFDRSVHCRTECCTASPGSNAARTIPAK